MNYDVEHINAEPCGGFQRACIHCAQCFEAYNSISDLTQHLCEKHLQSYPFFCSLCGTCAYDGLKMREHFSIMHPEHLMPAFTRTLSLEGELETLINKSIFTTLSLSSGTFGEVQHPIKESTGTPQAGCHQYEDGNLEAVENFQYVDQDPICEDSYEADPLNLTNVPQREDIVATDDFLCVEEYPQEAPVYTVQEVPTVGEAIQEDVPSSSSTDVYCAFGDEEPQPVEEPTTYVSVVEPTQFQAGKKVTYQCYFKCHYCPKFFSYASKLEEHIRVHTGQRVFQCTLCESRFANKNSLAVHLRTHTGSKPYECEWGCGSKFTSMSARRLHEKVHANPKGYVCPICVNGYTRSFHLRRHLKAVHNLDSKTFQPIQRVAVGGSGEAESLGVSSAVANVVSEIHRKVASRKSKKPKESIPLQPEPFSDSSNKSMTPSDLCADGYFVYDM